MPSKLMLDVTANGNHQELQFTANVDTEIFSHLPLLRDTIPLGFTGEISADGKLSVSENDLALIANIKINQFSQGSLTLQQPQLHIDGVIQSSDGKSIFSGEVTLQAQQLQALSVLADKPTFHHQGTISWSKNQFDRWTLGTSTGPVFSSKSLKIDKASMGRVRFTLNSSFQLLKTPDGWQLPAIKAKLTADKVALDAVTLSASPVSIEISPVQIPLSNKIDVRLTSPDLKIKTAERTWVLNSLTMDGIVTKGGLKAKGKTNLSQAALPIQFKLNYDHTKGSAMLETQASNVAAKELKKRLGNQFGASLKMLDLVVGKLNMDSSIRWSKKNGMRPPTINLKLLGLGGRYNENYFSGLNGDFKLTLGDTLTAHTPRLSIDAIDIGVPITHLRSAVSLTRSRNQALPQVKLNGFRAKFLGGIVSRPKINIDLNRTTNTLELDLEKIDLAQLVALHQLKDIKAAGRISGILPLRVGKAGISLQKGRISGDLPGGRIQYHPEDGGAALASAGHAGELLKILQDYHYHLLDAMANYTPDGKLSLHLFFKGKNPAQYGEQLINFNLNLEQNLLSLLKSLRAVQGINERLDQKVRHFHEKRMK
ncbi:MAG: hypothetical protein GY814_17420 [Gammaproteobacteria bacterium]|nr:hypothetical protein [Gammaproteobacteria bacterium]